MKKFFSYFLYQSTSLKRCYGHSIFILAFFQCLITLKASAQLPATISSFAPASGPVGTVVTITGTNFSPTADDNIVYFGAVKAAVSAATTTSLTVTAPAGTTYQPITVTTKNLTAYSSNPFIVTFPGGNVGFSSNTFAAGVDYTTELNPFSVSISDLDGDGKPDLIMASYVDSNSSGIVSVFRNTGTNGTISFATRVDYAKVDFLTYLNLNSVSIGDLDGDGKPDIAIVAYDTVSVLRNTSTSGTISFAEKVNCLTAINSGSVSIGDLDGDGRPDLAVGSIDSISVLKNTGTKGVISFAAKADYDIANTPSGISISMRDLDGDGKPDLAVTSGLRCISVLRNTSIIGLISFGPKIDVDCAARSTNPNSISIGDLDGDSKPDLAVANQNAYPAGVSVFRNTSEIGTISFSSKVDYLDSVIGSNGLSISDLSGDGKPDLTVLNNDLWTQKISILRNTSPTGDISFFEKADYVKDTINYKKWIQSFSIGDLDGDGKPDLAVVNVRLDNNSGVVSLLRNQFRQQGKPTITSFTPTNAGINTVIKIIGTNFTGTTAVSLGGTAAASFTVVSDSIITAVVGAIASGNVSVTTQYGTATLEGFYSGPVITGITPISGPVGTTVAITGTNFSPTAADNIVYFGAVKATVSASSSTSLTVTVPGGASYEPITVTNNYLTAYSNKPFNVTFPEDSGFTVNTFAENVDILTEKDYTSKVAIGDLDGDGKADLAMASRGKVTIIRNTGTAGAISFTGKFDYVTELPSLNVFLGDLNGDGKHDLVVSNLSSEISSISILKNTSSIGAFSFATKIDYNTIVSGNEYSNNKLYIVDLDGDGKPDIVSGTNDDTIFILKNTSSNGNLSFTKISLLKKDYGLVGPNSNSICVGDLDGDRSADLIVGSGSCLLVLRNTSRPGVLSFAQKVDINCGDEEFGAWEPEDIGDLDGDGKPDLINGEFVLRNTSSIGTITFAPSVKLSLSAFDIFNRGIGNFSMLDLNGDGKLDLVGERTTLYTQEVAVCRNTSTSGVISFTKSVGYAKDSIASSGYPTIWIHINSISIGDLNEDGKPDLILVKSRDSGEVFSTTVSILKNQFNQPIQQGPPIITSFTPTNAAIDSTITITGTNFTGATAVSLGGIAAASFSVVSDTIIKAVVGAYASGNVAVTTPYGTATLEGFNNTNNPSITSFNPTDAGIDSTITITGTNFTGATAVTLGGIAAKSFTVVSDTIITAIVGAYASGDVSVTTPYGTATLGGFDNAGPHKPSITSFNPRHGDIGSIITITGANFTGATAVSLGDKAVKSFTVVSDTVITAVVGAYASGDVSVTTPYGTATLGGFNNINSHRPHIYSFTPPNGGIGTTIIIRGINFYEATAVSLGGIAAASFTVVSDDEITAVVAAIAIGSVSVTTAYGADTLEGFNNKTIITLSIDSLNTTLCTGNSLSIPFTVPDPLNSNNIFTAQLSDSSGMFSNADNIGSSFGYFSGTIHATIPLNIKSGRNYHIRIISSSPITYSNEIPVTIIHTPESAFTITGTLNTCPGLQAYTVSGISSDNTYHYYWALSGGGTLDTTNSNAIVNWNTPGTYTLSLMVANDCGNSQTKSIQVTVKEAKPEDNPLSGSVTNMLPSDGNSSLSLPISFSWFPVENAATYDLYIWRDTTTRPLMPTISDITNISYTISGTNILQYEKTYKWQVIAKRDCYKVESPVQTFKLRNLPDLIVSNIQNPASGFSGRSISIKWDVKNIGLGRTLGQQWFDVVYLSKDTILDKGDNLLGSVLNPAELGPVQNYAQNHTFTLPEGINDNYYIFVVTNPYAAQKELDTSNNIGISTTVTSVQLTPPPDLKVTSIVPPNFIFSGQTIDLTYTVSNIGTGSTIVSSWIDYIYLTKDSVFNRATAFSFGPFLKHDSALAPEASYTQVIAVKIADTVFGKYFFFVKTDVSDQVYEHALEDNNTSRSDTVNILLTPPPDLLVSQITIPDSASNKENIVIKWRVENSGGSSTGSRIWIDKIYLSKISPFNQDSSILLGGTLRKKKLESGEGYDAEQNFNVPSSITGAWYVYVKADAGNNIFEYSYENNNVLKSNKQLKIISPDLIVSKMIIPTADSSGHAINIEWNVKNNGNGLLYNSSVSDRISISKQATFIADSVTEVGRITYTSQLLKGDSILRTAQVMIPDGLSGNYYLYIETDYANTVFEGLFENNNIRRSSSSIKITLSPWPDLIVTNVQIEDSVSQNDIVPITYSVKNKGLAKITDQTWIDRFYLSEDPLWQSGDTLSVGELIQTRTLEKDSSYQVNTGIKIPSSLPGKYYVYVFTDRYNNVYEHTAEANNVQKMDSVFIKKYPPIDLVVTSVSTPQSANSGTPISVAWTVENKGLAATLEDQWSDGLYLSADTIWDINQDIFVGDVVHTGVLNAGNSYQTGNSFVLPDSISGTYYLMLVTDDSYRNNDVNRRNNYMLKTGNGDSVKIVIALTPPPDLTVTSFIIPDEGISGQPLMAYYTIKNMGTGPTKASSWADKIFLSNDIIPDANDVAIDSKARTGILSPDEGYTDSIEVFLPIKARGNDIVGNYVIIIKTDANNNVFENLNENNNSANHPITVIRPPFSDLIVTDIALPSASVFAGDTVTLQWKLKNIGENPASGRMKEAVYLSEDTIKDVSDILITSKDAFINIAPQTEVERSFKVELAGVSLKEYYVLVHTDVLNNIYESNDSNNIAISANKLNVNVAQLPIDVLTQNSLRDNKEIYYRIIVPDSLQGESLLITLKGDSLYGANEMYLRLGEVPTRAVHDFSHNEAYQGNQEIIVPALIAGNWYLMVYGETGSGNVQQINLLANILQFEIRHVNANTGGNNGQVTIEVNGSKLGSVTSIKLRNAATVIDGDNIMIVNPTRLYVTVGLNGASLGDYDIIAMNEVGDSAVLTKGFKVVAGSAPNLITNVIAPPNTRLSRIISMYVQFTNAGNTDLKDPVLLLTSLGGAPIGFNVEDLKNNYQSLTLNLQEVNGPPGILRPGTSGTIIVYSKAINALGFTLEQLNTK